MPRRGYDRRRKCAQEGCREWSITNYEYKRDWADAVQREKRAGSPPWQCLRHSNPEKVLSVHNLQVAAECGRVASERHGTPMWEGAYHGGWATGPGFMAWADDFPLGTILVITAKIVLPDDHAPAVLPEPEPSQPTYFADRVELDS